MSRKLLIKIVVEEEKVGGILADLAGRIESLHFEVVEEVPHNKNNMGGVPALLNRQIKDDTGRAQVVKSIIEMGGTVQYSQMKDLLRKAHLSDKAAGAMLSALQKRGILSRIGVGLYRVLGDRG